MARFASSSARQGQRASSPVEAANPAMVARPGFQNSPIGLDEWLYAARKLPALQVRESSDHRPGSPDEPVVCLADDPSAKLTLMSFGQVVAPMPSRAMVEAMFMLAAELEAAVYSERRNVYASVDDWQTRSRRKRRSAGIMGWRHPAAKQLWGALGLLVVGLASVWVAVHLGSQG